MGLRAAVVGLFFVASGMGLGTTEAKACLFRRCHRNRQPVCAQPGYMDPSAQAGGYYGSTGPPATGMSPMEADIQRLKETVFGGEPFPVRSGSGTTEYRIQTVPPR
jgi:hypothetical protein